MDNKSTRTEFADLSFQSRVNSSPGPFAIVPKTPAHPSVGYYYCEDSDRISGAISGQDCEDIW